jgi:hypothetical protein
MLNAMHVNENGNILIGLEVLRQLKLDMTDIPHKEPLMAVMKVHRELIEKMEM